MQLVIVFLVFIVMAVFSIILMSKFSEKFWERAEYMLLATALLGITATVADINASRKEQEIFQAMTASQSSKSHLINRTEWVMNSCGVWWDDVINQTNKAPPECVKTHPMIENETCESSCRAAHLVLQHRMQAYEPSAEYLAASGLYRNICYDGAADIGVCNFLASYRDFAAEHASLSRSMSLYDYVSSNQVSFWIQILFALTLGVQAGKIRRDAREK